MCARILGTNFFMRLSRTPSILMTPLMPSKHSLQFLPYMMPTKTQNTLSSNSSSMTSNCSF